MMKRNDCFVTKKVCDSTYLLPVGQMIAEYNNGIRLNGASEYIWDQLENDISAGELIDRCAAHFEADEDEKENLREDIMKLVDDLKKRGMLAGSQNVFKCSCANCRNGQPIPGPEYDCEWLTGNAAEKKSFRKHGTFIIGGLQVEMFGDGAYFDAAFEDFRSENDKENGSRAMRIYVINTGEAGEGQDYPEGVYYDEDDASNGSEDFDTGDVKTLIHCTDLTVLEYRSKYVLFFYGIEGVKELHMTKDGTRAVFYCDGPSDVVKFGVFHAIRMAFLIYALKQGKVMLHSCSVLWNGKAWAFSAPSGTGKSTHCEMWNRLYGTPYVNGDLNLIGMEHNIPYVYGTPWCGSSETYDPATYPLGGIILLKRGSVNSVEDLSEEKKILLVQQRLISSVWDRNMLDATFDLVTDIVKNTFVKKYYCTKEDDACITIRDYISEQNI